MILMMCDYITTKGCNLTKLLSALCVFYLSSCNKKHMLCVIRWLWSMKQFEMLASYLFPHGWKGTHQLWTGAKKMWRLLFAEILDSGTQRWSEKSYFAKTQSSHIMQKYNQFVLTSESAPTTIWHLMAAKAQSKELFCFPLYSITENGDI